MFGFCCFTLSYVGGFALQLLFQGSWTCFPSLLPGGLANLSSTGGAEESRGYEALCNVCDSFLRRCRVIWRQCLIFCKTCEANWEAMYASVSDNIHPSTSWQSSSRAFDTSPQIRWVIETCKVVSRHPWNLAFCFELNLLFSWQISSFLMPKESSHGWRSYLRYSGHPQVLNVMRLEWDWLILLLFLNYFPH